MKAVAFLVLALAGILVLTNQFKDSVPSTPYHVETTVIHKPSIHTVMNLDVTGSILFNGVELISCSIFQPYFTSIDRNIQLDIGIVDSLSPEQLITISLPAKNFSAPVLQDLRKLSITEKRREKEWYQNAITQYSRDSTEYYNDRQTRINEFCIRVDSRIALYKDKLSGRTDLVTAVQIADKAFQHCAFGSVQKYLLVYSDGFDSFGRHATKLRNNPEVILINASGNSATSLDSIITLRLQSPEQAIEFTLSNLKNQ